DVLVVRDERDRGTGGDALEYAGQNFGPVLLIARRGDFALPHPAPVKLYLNVVDGERQPRWASLNHDAKGWPVGFAPGGQLENSAEAAAHRLLSSSVAGPGLPAWRLSSAPVVSR